MQSFVLLQSPMRLSRADLRREDVNLLPCTMQDARQELTIERLQRLYDELRREVPPRRKRPSSLTVVDSVGHDDSGSKPHWCA